MLEEEYSESTVTGSAAYTYPSNSNRIFETVSDASVTLRTFTHTPGGHISLETKRGSMTDYNYNEANRLAQIVCNAVLSAGSTYDVFERRL